MTLSMDALPLAYAYHKARQQHETRIKPWSSWARPEQLPPPGDWRTWLVLAGRGFGKTRLGAEAIQQWVAEGKARRVLVVAQTAADARDVSVEALRTRIVGRDDSGQILLGLRPDVTYEPSKRRVSWDNGAYATTFSAEDPDSIRGYQGDTAWLDELAAWRFPESYDQLQPALRVGWARQIVTTTPRPTPIIKELIASPTTVVTRGRTWDNRENLAPSALAYLLARYEGTRLGRQELDGEVLEGDNPGALWSHQTIEGKGLIRYGEAPTKDSPTGIALDMSRIVVAVDPAVTSGEHADDTGIIVVGKGRDGLGYVLDDRSCHLSPDGWARRAVAAYEDHRADSIVAEANNGGDMVKIIIGQVDPHVPVKLVYASQGKRTRATPVSLLYEQGRVLHVKPMPALEDEMTGWEPDSRESPDRMDALVWGLSELFLSTATATSTSYMPSDKPPVIRRGDLVLRGARYVDKVR